MEKDYEIIAVDFDGTLCYSNWPELGEPNQALIAYLKNWIDDALSKAVGWCQNHGLEFDAVNDNLPEIVEFYGSNSRKITCDYYRLCSTLIFF